MIDTLAVHCSESPDGRDDRAADIHRWHRERGWDGIGYHAVICRDGTVEQGRPEYWTGAHIAGHNANSLGVCLIGTRDFTDSQMRALHSLLRVWLERYPGAQVVGHYELDPGKTCPNIDMARLRASL